VRHNSMKVGIIGAGPAGSLCASILSHWGWEVVLFDHRGSWEKPCGGGVTCKALSRYPFLKDCLETHREIRSLKVTSPGDASMEVSLDEPILIYSRTALNRLLLDRAIAQGAQFCQERVLDFRRQQSAWQLRTNQADHRMDFLVGADGVNSFVRKKLSSHFVSEDLMMTFGYRVPRELGDRIEIKFFPKFLGYYWAFPRPDHVSFGICGRLSQYATFQLKEYLHGYLQETGHLRDVSETRDWPVYSALIPSLSAQSLRDNLICGKGWALLGDAAGFADPITCEGIYFALRSGELLARALIAGEVSAYHNLCHTDFVADFMYAADLFHRFYTGKFLGADFITRMVQTTARSRALRQIMNAFVAGQQNYQSLQTNLMRKTPQILLQMVGSALVP
jgi:flavin-dependent dehydrogenase